LTIELSRQKTIT